MEDQGGWVSCPKSHNRTDKYPSTAFWLNHEGWYGVLLPLEEAVLNSSSCFSWFRSLFPPLFPLSSSLSLITFLMLSALPPLPSLSFPSCCRGDISSDSILQPQNTDLTLYRLESLAGTSVAVVQDICLSTQSFGYWNIYADYSEISELFLLLTFLFSYY